MQPPVQTFLNDTDRRSSGISLTGSLQEWLDKNVPGDLAIDADETPGRLGAQFALPHNISMNVGTYSPHIQALKSRLLADGWNTVNFYFDSGHGLVMLSALSTPLVVKCVDGDFFPELAEDEPAEKAAERIAREGAWRHFLNGDREFVAPHRILSVRLEGHVRRTLAGLPGFTFEKRV